MIPRVKLHGKRFENFVHSALAVSKRFERYADFVQQRQMQIGEWLWLGVLKVLTSTMPSSCATCDDNG